VGASGGLAIRFWQASAMDRYGARSVWLGSLFLFAVSCGAHLGVARVDGFAIYGLRLLTTISVAGMFGASTVHVSRSVPVERMAEAIATLGSSGILGIAAGPMLGDWILGGERIGRPDLDRMFLVAAALAVAAAGFVWLGTRASPPAPARRRASLIRLVRRYNPGWICLMSLAMGFGLALPGTFLRPFTAEVGIAEMKAFFLVYTATAFVARIGTRRMTSELGVRAVVTCGMAALVASDVAFLAVDRESMLPLPAALFGFAHAVLFPAVVAGGSRSFPDRYRGLGTTLMLAASDLGTLVGAPFVGGLLHWADEAGWSAYPTMFLTVAAALSLLTAVYLAFDRKK
jgi:MFS family permease